MKPDVAAAPPAPPEPRAPELTAAWTPLRPRSALIAYPDGSFDNLEWLDLPPGHARLDLARLERDYFAWVPRLTAGLVRPQWREPALSLGLEPLHRPTLIRMDAPGDGAGARARPIVGGILAEPGGSFGFELHPRAEGTRLVVAVRRLRPRLPGPVYRRVQARLHVRSTWAFLRDVARQAAR